MPYVIKWRPEGEGRLHRWPATFSTPSEAKTEVRLTNRVKAAPRLGFLCGRLGRAVTILRQRRYTPVHAQRLSDASTEQTGFWVVGRKVSGCFTFFGGGESG